MSDTATELEWMKMVLKELGHPHSTLMTIFCDNNSVVALKTSTLHFKSKCFVMIFHFVLERVTAKTLEIHFVRSEDQATDLLTKALPRASFQCLQSKLETATWTEGAY